MSRSQRPRKPYRPRYAPGYMLLAQQRDEIVMPVHTALAAMEMGGGSIALRHTLASFINIASGLAGRMQSAAETPRILADAMHAMVAADRRWLESHRWGFSGQEMRAIRAAVTVGDELVKRANSAVLWSVVDAVTRLVGDGKQQLGTASQPLGPEMGATA